MLGSSNRSNQRGGINGLHLLTLAAVVSVYVVGRSVFGSSSYVRRSHQQNDPAFSLLVKLRFEEESYKQQFLRDIGPVASYVKQHEPQTLAYEVLLSDSDPLQVLIIERYADKEKAYLEIHKSSEEFLQFRPKLKAMMEEGKVSMDGHSYIDSQVGFF
uniref:ABM domain-containing protein n=1 Tax=Grammatophora oceanica TaxID=210454 RepID=A0A7S1UNL8_9STRA|mmetsp:Transcript_13761/g.20159  ORF Transcript_13761/g.20159 Transcript_13761/m.20159 type:complete len:158 (+) Transcript_13761:126-599(+)|eukprot:CAMPEP_0194049440 /NCGR_PEP_ID=MMETSP0009_2-20130614/30678_1 /TAXON_ID=210454 /ORGANISM="Grammatophora oceanica, Strain CCMP 410" /LENGTH=157 /DNA_ID=CAMNT_0038695601 /DNA_START=126 /DNA_END=602 /DNA_ORIENTATION=-